MEQPKEHSKGAFDGAFDAAASNAALVDASNAALIVISRGPIKYRTHRIPDRISIE